jgi:hypothetical protein
MAADHTCRSRIFDGNCIPGPGVAMRRAEDSLNEEMRLRSGNRGGNVGNRVWKWNADVPDCCAKCAVTGDF